MYRLRIQHGLRRGMKNNRKQKGENDAHHSSGERVTNNT
jgi:hypothetical protein